MSHCYTEAKQQFASHRSQRRGTPRVDRGAAKLECVLRAYAQANPEDGCWVFPALMFRQAVAREFERLVAGGVPVGEEPEADEAELDATQETCAAAQA